MANTLLQMGSSGKKVRELQELLNTKGYSLTVDGIYGDKTRSAVRNYQKQKALQVDGIVGDETWGALYNQQDEAEKKEEIPAEEKEQSPEESFKQMDTSQRLEMYETERPEFVPDSRVEEAYRQYEAILSQRPGEFAGSYDEQIDQVLQKILHPEAFRYDPSSDAAWQSYREQYTQGARQASLDTLGQAAGLTGGYGNSYAQTAAAQAYQQYMTGLSAKLPELQEMAYERYRKEQEDLYEQAAILMGLREEEYEKYRDGFEDWQKQSQDAYDFYRDLYDADWDRFEQEASLWEKDRRYYYDKGQDEAKAQAEAQKSQGGGSSSGGSSAKKVKRTLTFSNYLSRATTRYNAEGAQGLLQYLQVNRDAEGVKGLTDEEIELICRQFGFSRLADLRAQAEKEAANTQTKEETKTPAAVKKPAGISVR